jgi:hypothetical protein
MGKTIRETQINKICTLLYCQGWKPNDVEQLKNNITHRYKTPRIMGFALGRAYDLFVGGKSIEEVIELFKPESERN